VHGNGGGSYVFDGWELALRNVNIGSEHHLEKADGGRKKLNNNR
jgi:hypothetical protein